MRVTIEPAENVFCWQLQLNGKPVDRWQVKHPRPGQRAVFYLEGLEPNREQQLEITAVSPGGRASPRVRTSALASAALGRASLGVLEPPRPLNIAPREVGPVQVWALPGLIKISPTDPTPVANDMDTIRPGVRADATANAVWDGRQVYVFGARGEYVSFQICVQSVDRGPLTSIQVRPQSLAGPDGEKIGVENVELFWNWYARNRQGQWQPAYCIPMEPGTPLGIPQSDHRLPEQRNQTIYVDLYVPKDAKPGTYTGAMLVSAGPGPQIEVPVILDVLGFTLPDRLSFWPELGAYRIPAGAVEHYRLAHQHRCVLNCMSWRPKVTGQGPDAKVEWDQYDRRVGPLLTGEAMAKNRRSGVPVECMYLPFDDNWPTQLSPETYSYSGYWPKQGDGIGRLAEHSLTAPYLGEGLSPQYQDAFLAVQRQFIEHFRQMGYHRTEMQCCFVGKAANRIDFGSNSWWTTDEPYYWDDWLAVQFFLQMWARGRADADPRTWTARADVSRPQWQGRTLNGVVDAVYFGAGGFSTPAMVRRCRALGQETGLNVRAYGSASPDTASNLENITTLLTSWTDGADALAGWQTLGSDKALDANDAGAEGGSALLVPGDRFHLPVVADMRLKALRDGQQLIEYLTLLAERRQLTREQMKVMIHEALRSGGRGRTGRPVADVDGLSLGQLSSWSLCQLRRRIADMLTTE
jgi:hypothetical protein